MSGAQEKKVLQSLVQVVPLHLFRRSPLPVLGPTAEETSPSCGLTHGFRDTHEGWRARTPGRHAIGVGNRPRGDDYGGRCWWAVRAWMREPPDPCLPLRSRVIRGVATTLNVEPTRGSQFRPGLVLPFQRVDFPPGLQVGRGVAPDYGTHESMLYV